MIPLRDTVSSKNIPIVNYSIIIANFIVFFANLTMGENIHEIRYIYGIVPARWSVPEISAYFSFWQQLFSFISFMFLHGGFWHLLGNMWSLYIFGDNVEDRLGHLSYLIFYIICGISSGLVHIFLNSYSNVPTIGASGAIAGIMGAYIILYPRAKILTFIPILIIPWFIQVPAFLFLGIWFIIQFLNAASGLSEGVAWWAHVGGFVAGIIFLKLFLRIPLSVRIADSIQSVTQKRKTNKLQVIAPVGIKDDDPNLYGTINVSSFEAAAGTQKIVNLSWGFHKKILKITIPPNIALGSRIRLTGLGRQTENGIAGDLILEVVIL